MLEPMKKPRGNEWRRFNGCAIVECSAGLAVAGLAAEIEGVEPLVGPLVEPHLLTLADAGADNYGDP